MDEEILNLPQHVVEQSTLPEKLSWLIEINVLYQKLGANNPIANKIKEYLTKSSVANMSKMVSLIKEIIF